MKRPWFYFLLGVISAYAFLFVIWGLGFLGKTALESAFDRGGGGETVNITDTATSPDGEYVATTYVAVGGGAAGWCFQRVSINKKETPFSWKKEKEHGGFSFDVSCHSKVGLTWQGNRELLISYTGTNNETGITTYQRPHSGDGMVKISYLPKP